MYGPSKKEYELLIKLLDSNTTENNAHLKAPRFEKVLTLEKLVQMLRKKSRIQLTNLMKFGRMRKSY